MNTTVLATTAMNLGERVAYAGRMLLIGMLTVFTSLAILWGALALFRVVLAAIKPRKTDKKEQPAAPAPVAPAAPVSATNEEEIVAAITAAVSLLLAEEHGGTAPAFRVVSFRRTRGNAK